MADFDPTVASNQLGDEELKQTAARMRAVGLPQTALPPVRPVTVAQPQQQQPTAPQQTAADTRKAMRNEPVAPPSQAPVPDAPKPVMGSTQDLENRVRPLSPMADKAAAARGVLPEQQEATQGMTPEDMRVRAAQLQVDNIQNKPAGIARLIPITEGEGFGHRLLRGAEHVGRGVLTAAETAGNIAAPGVMLNIPGTQFNRAVRLQGAESQLGEAEKNRTEAATAEAERAKATGVSAQSKLNADMAAKDLYPTTDTQGRTTYQRINRDLTDEEFAGKTPDQQLAYATYKAMVATTPEEKATWTQKADAAKAGANAKTAPPTAEGDKIAMQTLDTQLRQNPQGVSVQDRNKLAGFQRDQIKAGLNAEALLAAGKPPVPADYPTGYSDQKYISDNKAWQQNYDTAFRGLPVQQEAASKTATAQMDAKVKSVKPPIQKEYAESQATLDKIDAAKTELASGNAGQAAGVIKTLSALASGAGSGVRITGAELNMLVHNTRGLGADMEAKWNKIVGGENIVLTPDQITGLDKLLDQVKAHVAMKTGVARHALDQIDQATSTKDVAQAAVDQRKYYRAIEQGKAFTRSEAEAVAGSKNMKAEDVEKSLTKQGMTEIPE